ncbi:MAG: MFS transporter [candidate division WOR-3 bacterium]|nr:MFS transporter [candidate division WOR-3 bacterium]MDW8150942.1 MFS transporter [candidate division WOR-3 bacterium]
MALLVLTQFFVGLADQIYISVIPFLVITIEMHNASLKAGIVSFIETLPFLTISFLAGILADRYNKKLLLIISAFFSGLFLLTIPIFNYLGKLNWIIIAITGFLVSSFATLYPPARDALIPYLVKDKDKLFYYNAIVQSSYQFALFLGGLVPPIVLFLRNDLVFLVLIDAFVLIVASTFLFPIRYSENAKFKEKISLTEDLKSFITILTENRSVRLLVILTALDNFFIMGLVTIGASLYIKNYLSLGAREFAIFNAVLSLGWFISAIIISKLKLDEIKMLKLGIFLDGFTYIPLFFVKDFGLSLIFIFIHGLVIPLITVSRTTIIQKYVNEEIRGRVFSLIYIAVIGFMSISGLFMGFLGEFLDANYLFLVGGIGGSIVGIMSFYFKIFK